MAVDPLEFVSPRERLLHNINMRSLNGGTAPPSGNLVREDTDFFGEDGFDFDDFLDIVNPLQHLPVISIIYRELTGDEISPGARVIGGGLFGGPVGAMVGAVEAAATSATDGEDIATVAWKAIVGDDEEAVAVAEAEGGALDALNPAAGVIEVSEAPIPWIDPNKQTLAAQSAQAVQAPPQPGAIATIQAAQTQGPAVVLSQASALPQPLSQAGAAAAASGADGAIPELTQDQVALLLSSVGLKPEGEAEAGAVAQADDAPSNLIEPRAAAPAAQHAQAEADAVRKGLGPMKQHYVRPPGDNSFVKHAPITQEMRTHMSNRTTPLSEADQAWVAEAMAAALDKYRNGKTQNDRGSTVDAAH